MCNYKKFLDLDLGYWTLSELGPLSMYNDSVGSMDQKL